MEKDVIKEFYKLISILGLSAKTLKLVSKEHCDYTIDNLLITNEYLYNRLLIFGINHIGLAEE